MKLHKNDRSNKSSILDILSSQVICPCPGAIYMYMYKIMKKIYVKSDFRSVYLKLTADGQSGKSFL